MQYTITRMQGSFLSFTRCVHYTINQKNPIDFQNELCKLNPNSENASKQQIRPLIRATIINNHHKVHKKYAKYRKNVR